MIKKDKYPLELLKGVEPLLQKFMQFENLYADLIEKKDDRVFFKRKGLLYLNFLPRNKDLKFYFRVFDIQLEEEGWFTTTINLKYYFDYIPYSTTQVLAPSGYCYKGALEGVVFHFNQWIGLIKEYEKVKTTEAEIWLLRVTDEFYEEFKISDPDAKTAPFNSDQQIFICKLLEFVATELKKSGKSDPATAEIINDIKNLQAAIPDLTKEVIVQFLAKIFAKIRRLGINMLTEVFDVAKKELIKKALYGGVQEMQYLIHHVF